METYLLILTLLSSFTEPNTFYKKNYKKRLFIKVGVPKIYGNLLRGN